MEACLWQNDWKNKRVRERERERERKQKQLLCKTKEERDRQTEIETTLWNVTTKKEWNKGRFVREVTRGGGIGRGGGRVKKKWVGAVGMESFEVEIPMRSHRAFFMMYENVRVVPSVNALNEIIVQLRDYRYRMCQHSGDWQEFGGKKRGWGCACISGVDRSLWSELVGMRRWRMNLGRRRRRRRRRRRK